MSKIRLCFFCPSRNILSTRSDMVMVRPRRGREEECGCGYDWYGYLPHWPSVSRPHTEYASCNPTREMGDHYFMQRFIFWRITCQSSICRRAMHWLESILLRKTAYNTIAFRKKSWDECIISTLTYIISVKKILGMISVQCLSWLREGFLQPKNTIFRA